MRENKAKKSQLVFEPRVTRKLLKLNGEIKYCPFCGKDIKDNCECHKNIVVDVKPYRNSEGIIEPDRSVLVFDNNVAFQADYNQMMEEMKAKKEEKSEIEIEYDIDVEVEIELD